MSIPILIHRTITHCEEGFHHRLMQGRTRTFVPFYRAHSSTTALAVAADTTSLCRTRTLPPVSDLCLQRSR